MDFGHCSDSDIQLNKLCAMWTLTLVDMNNIRVLDGAHDLHLSSYAYQIGIRFDFAFFYCLDGDLLASFLIDS